MIGTEGWKDHATEDCERQTRSPVSSCKTGGMFQSNAVPGPWRPLLGWSSGWKEEVLSFDTTNLSPSSVSRVVLPPAPLPYGGSWGGKI